MIRSSRTACSGGRRPFAIPFIFCPARLFSNSAAASFAYSRALTVSRRKPDHGSDLSTGVADCRRRRSKGRTLTAFAVSRALKRTSVRLYHCNGPAGSRNTHRNFSPLHTTYSPLAARSCFTKATLGIRCISFVIFWLRRASAGGIHEISSSRPGSLRASFGDRFHPGVRSI